ncbi:hypothetical protein T4E_4536 [Trichinella pseudospiralis]|uniref:Uncharacterized protein n=1 Tax=Trichinella pseudospiralis TaxID=6337 RepID=A0A0V0XJQ8_TRIPS|nr:hypothetical protein T4E_4536 [Trichinella pseudospiralis]
MHVTIIHFSGCFQISRKVEGSQNQQMKIFIIEDGRNSISRYPYSLRRSSDESDEQNHRISARSSVKKTKSKGEHASTSTEDIEATATELFLYFAFSGRPMQLEWMDRLPLLRVNHLT